VKTVPFRPERAIMAVLVPHGESRAKARAISASLFMSGVAGAWAFPWVIPLALLDRPLSPDELKALAIRLRERTGTDGKICTGEWAALPFPAGSPAFLQGLSVYGPVCRGWSPVCRGWSPSADVPLAFSLSSSPSALVFPRAVLGCALIQDGATEGTLPFPQAPGISFRAAAAANMFFRPLDTGLSFAWKTGKLFWLPAVRKRRSP
jgi:hypothetical protein